MKIRTGFVSNSSSSSFVIDLHALSPRQIEQIQNHVKYAKAWKMDTTPDQWDIGVNDGAGVLWGETYMNNFNMALFLHKAGVDDLDILWNGAETARVRDWSWYDKD